LVYFAFTIPFAESPFGVEALRQPRKQKGA
jgi:hypothetical protein